MVKTGLRGYPYSADSLIHREVRMQQSFQKCSSQPGINEEVFIIPQDVFRALHPIEKLMARSLERIDKVLIEKDDLTR